MPAISILIPSYGHAAYLSECLASIQAQSFTDFEVILIDDRSPDDSLSIAERFAAGDARFRVSQNEVNSGTYQTLTNALERAQSPWIGVMNSDDFWLPTKLALQMEAIAQNPDVAACYVLGAVVGQDGKPDPRFDQHADWPVTPRQELMPFLAYENRVLASGVLFRREGLRFETTCRYSGDWVALLEAASRGAFACVPENLTFWRVHGENAHLRSFPQLAEELRVRQAIHRQSRELSANQNSQAMRRGVGANAIAIAAIELAFGMRSEVFPLLPTMLGHELRVTGLRRWLAAFLPGDRVRSRLWPGDEALFASLDIPACRNQLRAQKPLELRLRQR